MRHVKIIPSKLEGKIHIPASKSLSHRAIMAAGLADGISTIDNVLYADDILATCEAMEALGVHVERKEYSLIVKGPKKLTIQRKEIHCKESGSTLRFFVPIALLTGERVTFHGEGKLTTRPLDVYFEIFEKQGIAYTYEGRLPLTVQGSLKPGDFQVRGDVSSQFITGLLYTLPLLEGDSSIHITTPLESKSYVDLTMDVLKRFSIDIQHDHYQVFYIKGHQKYKSADYRVEGDFSQAAFWIVAGTLGGDILCSDVHINSSQGDKAIIEIVEKMGGKIEKGPNQICVKPSKTHGITIDASQCPDLVPILAVLGAFSEGTTEIINAARLRIKESDRLKAIATELNKLGADVKEKEDGLIICGKESLQGGTVDSWNDHRIAMALAIASIRCTEPVMITNSSAVSKSYPEFFSDFEKLGGKVHEWHMG